MQTVNESLLDSDYRKRGSMRRFFSVVFLSIFLMLGCSSGAFPFSSGASSYFSKRDDLIPRDVRDVVKELERLEAEDSREADSSPLNVEQYERRFLLVQQVINMLNLKELEEHTNLFLTTYVTRNPDDPFNGYYLLMVAENYRKLGADDFAVLYYQQIRNYPDLEVHGESTHFFSLKQLTNLVEQPEVRVSYYREMISRYYNYIDKASVYYYLAKTYEELGEWELSIQTYKKFLAQESKEIAGKPGAEEEVETLIRFYDWKDKSWIRQDLDDLVGLIQSAIRQGNMTKLESYRAKVNFFAKTWDQHDNNLDIEFIEYLRTFWSTSVYCARELETDSNNKEAYLRTGEWSTRIRTWYFYFRRIDFPADPEIHGKWEWAGIYFGEKPFSRTAE